MQFLIPIGLAFIGFLIFIYFVPMNLWITLIIVVLTYIGIALGEFQPLRANRTTLT